MNDVWFALLSTAFVVGVPFVTLKISEDKRHEAKKKEAAKRWGGQYRIERRESVADGVSFVVESQHRGKAKDVAQAIEWMDIDFHRSYAAASAFKGIPTAWYYRETCDCQGEAELEADRMWKEQQDNKITREIVA
jgi:hypothetical protein